MITNAEAQQAFDATFRLLHWRVQCGGDECKTGDMKLLVEMIQHCGLIGIAEPPAPVPIASSRPPPFPVTPKKVAEFVRRAADGQ